MRKYAKERKRWRLSDKGSLCEGQLVWDPFKINVETKGCVVPGFQNFVKWKSILFRGPV